MRKQWNEGKGLGEEHTLYTHSPKTATHKTYSDGGDPS